MLQNVRVRLDSSQPLSGGWTFVPAAGAPVRAVLRCDDAAGGATLTSVGGIDRRWPDPLEALRWLDAHARAIDDGSRWVGYLSYDLGRLFERLPATSVDDLRLPLFAFALAAPDPESSPMNPATDPIAIPAMDPARVTCTFSRAAYLAAIDRTIDYIRAGDIFQANLSQRFTVPMPAAAPAIYARLLRDAPARHGALLEFDDHALICNSPELFLRVEPGPRTGLRRVTTRPIKGTRPRRRGADAELRDSTKDQAELNMIVDLERNDLGRVCAIGSVRVTQPPMIEAHPTVYHGAATIAGMLRPDVGFVELLAATFPGGSITGAPKIRAMQIIEELEPVRRGPYCGAIGYLAGGGQMELNVAIRTMIAARGHIHVPVGGGIVADSQPAAEHEETLVKARALFAALGLDAVPA